MSMGIFAQRYNILIYPSPINHTKVQITIIYKKAFNVIIKTYGRAELVNTNITVYLVEDCDLTRIGLKAAINEFKGIKLAGETDNANRAIKEILEIQPDVVLMDIGLPGMNGFEAAKKIKTSVPSTKIIMLTSHNKESEVLAALSSGATGYCLKNISSELLEEVIKMIDRGICWLDSSISNVVLKNLPKIENINNMNTLNLIDTKYKLSSRELNVLRLLINGRSNEEIAKELNISIHTAKAHVGSIFRKLSVTDRVQAAVKAVKEKITE